VHVPRPSSNETDSLTIKQLTKAKRIITLFRLKLLHWET